MAIKNKPKGRVAYQFIGTHKATGKKVTVSVLKAEPETYKVGELRWGALQMATDCCSAISKTAKAEKEKAIDAIRVLIGDGCDWVHILAYAEMYCRLLSEDYAMDISKFLRAEGKKIGRLLGQIDKWEQRIRELNSEIEELLHVDMRPHIPDFTSYRGALCIAGIHALPKARKLMLKEEMLVCLYHVVKLSARKPHFKELANILQARLNCASIEESSLPRTISDFKKTNPIRCETLKRQVRAEQRLRLSSPHSFPLA